MAACLDKAPTPAGPETTLALHFDSLSAQASAATQPNRVAALNLILRTVADGGIPGRLILSIGAGAHDTATYNTATWGAATLAASASAQDSLTDSLIVFLGWRGDNADTIVVLRNGDPRIVPQVGSELATLGLTSRIATSDSTDSLTSAGFIVGNTVVVADSGAISGSFGIFGTACQFTTVSSIVNDASDHVCDRELFGWTFGVRFSPSTRLGLSTASYSPGVVVEQ